MPAEIRDSDEAKLYILQGLPLGRTHPLTPESALQTIEWMFCLASSDEALLPAGILIDTGNLILGEESPAEFVPTTHEEFLPETVARQFEDIVLGKFYADATFERGSTAVCRMSNDDRPRGLAWLIARFAERAGSVGVRCMPGILRSLRQLSGSQLLQEMSQAVQQPPHPLLRTHYESLIAGTRLLGEVLGAEDVFELERGTCLMQSGQRLALRQVLRLSDTLSRSLSPLCPRPSSRSRNIVTRMHADDAYPVGGFTSISTRGTIESLLHSQLAYMEPADQKQDAAFDMFDVKFLRNELLYYSRDENEFLRRRRRFVIVFTDELQTLRVKDAESEYQRIIVLLAVILVCVQRLIEWLGDDALHFELCFPLATVSTGLDDERELCELLLSEQVQNGTASVVQRSQNELLDSLTEHSYSQLTHCVFCATNQTAPEPDNVLVTHLVAGTAPQIITDTPHNNADADLAWADVPARLLQELV